jgi:hypothetical protein
MTLLKPPKSNRTRPKCAGIFSRCDYPSRRASAFERMPAFQRLGSVKLRWPSDGKFRDKIFDHIRPLHLKFEVKAADFRRH